MSLKKTLNITPDEPYFNNENVFVTYELQHGRDVIVPGTIIKFRHDRSSYKFRLLAHHIKEDVTWIDCINVSTQQWHSFYVEKLKGVVKPKRSRRHKANHD